MEIRTTVRIDQELFKLVKKKCIDEHISVTYLLTTLLKEWVKEKE